MGKLKTNPIKIPCSDQCLHEKRLIPIGSITFHELAEAYAKVELGYEYLRNGPIPGAHEVAINREIILKHQRPNVETVTTIGPNWVYSIDDKQQRTFLETKIRELERKSYRQSLR